MSPAVANDKPYSPPTSYAEAGPPGRWLTRERVLVLALLAATVVVFYLCYRLAIPFLPALAWAAALAVMAHPIHLWIARRVKQPDTAALLAVAVVVVLFVVPALFIANQLALQAAAGAQAVREQTENGGWRRAIENNPRLEPGLRWMEQNVSIEQEAARLVQSVIGDVASLLSNSIWMVVQTLITLYLLFFFFRDRDKVLNGVRSLVPLSPHETSEVFKRVGDTIHAVVNGTLLMAALQGFLGGLMFWFLDMPAPVLWGVVMALLAVIPYLGTFVVWAPVAVFMALQGEWGKAALLAGWGAVVIGLIDNLLYPLVVGKQLRMHAVLAFIGIVGGIGVFGGSGVILGPVVIAVAMALVEVWRRRTADGRPAEAGVRDGMLSTT